MCIRDSLGITLSITTLNEDVRRTMEPRTSSVAKRLQALEVLTNAGIQVNVNMAPIIPGINSDEVFSLTCLLYTSPSPRDRTRSRMPSSA